MARMYFSFISIHLTVDLGTINDRRDVELFTLGSKLVGQRFHFRVFVLASREGHDLIRADSAFLEKLFDPFDGPATQTKWKMQRLAILNLVVTP